MSHLVLSNSEQGGLTDGGSMRWLKNLTFVVTPELRDGALPAPDIPEGADGAHGVVADSRSGYVARLVGE